LDGGEVCGGRKEGSKEASESKSTCEKISGESKARKEDDVSESKEKEVRL
jgi:hypothetical protein